MEPLADETPWPPDRRIKAVGRLADPRIVDLWDLMLLPVSGVTTWFGRAAVALWSWGPAPDVAYEPGSYGARSAVGKTYRVVWRTGQVIGWAVLTPVIAALLWRIYVR